MSDRDNAMRLLNAVIGAMGKPLPTLGEIADAAIDMRGYRGMPLRDVVLDAVLIGKGRR